MRYRLLAVDLDGTLLNSRKELTEENRRALSAAREAGVAIAIVTGRRFPALRPYLEQLDFEPLVVANSGAIIKRGIRGPILSRRLLPLETAVRILAFAEDAAMAPVVHDGPDAEGLLILRSNARELPAMRRYLNMASPPPRWVVRIHLERDPVQIGFADTVTAIRDFERRLARGLTPDLAVSLARTEYPLEDLALLDVLSSEATKSKGLEFLSAHLSIPLRETMAIGDNWNDLEMLERAGLGVVMANAADELRGLGLRATATNDEGGVAVAIERYLLGEGKKKGGEAIHPRSRYP